MSPLMLVLSGVPQRFILGQVLFNDFINGVHSGIEYTLSKFTDKKKLCDAVDSPKDEMPSTLTLTTPRSGNLVRCNIAKCKVLHLDCSNCMNTGWRMNGLRAKNDLGVLVD